MTFIQGSGGGKGGGGSAASRVPVETPDSLRTKSYVAVLDLLGAGEWKGLASGLQSVFLDGVPVQNPDGSFNYSGVTFDFRSGAMSQSRIPKAVGAESATTVNVEVKAATPVERIISNSETDVVRVALHFPQLTTQNTANGDLTGARVDYRIEYKPNGGSWIPVSIGVERQGVAPSGFTASDVAYLGVVATLPKRVVTEVRTYGRNDNNIRTISRVVLSACRVDAYLTEAGVERLVDSRSFPNSGETEYRYELAAATTPGNASSWRLVLTPLESGWVNPGGASAAYAQKLVASPTGTVSGKTTSGYTRTHSVRLTGSAPWVIRVSRITPDSTSTTLSNKMYFESFTAVIEEKLRYPGCVLSYLAVDAEQFSSVPTRAFDVYMKIIKVPTNYNPLTREYTGAWDGTFKMDWSDNPAWVFYDLLLDPDNGVGDRINASMIDKWELYTIGQYCDELVPDGLGGSEPRFTCNIYLQERKEAFAVLRDLASVFRGMTYWASGAIIATQDAPQNPVYQFNCSNVIDGQFNYTSSSRNARHNVALVTWNDPADFYKQKTEYVADEEAIAQQGFVNETSVVAIGCTSRGQAFRVGKWLLYTEQYESETVTFTAGLEGNIPRPGDVILVADEFRSGERRGGRVAAATATSVTMDAPLSFVSSTSYSVSVVTPAGAVETKPLVAGQSGSLTTVQTASPWSNTPEPQATFIISSSDLEPQKYRVVSVSEKNAGQFEITALLHYDSKYQYVDSGADLIIPDTSNLSSAVPAAPASLNFSEYLYISGLQVEVGVTVSWPAPALAATFNLAYRRGDENWVSVSGLATSYFEIRNAREGIYTFKVEGVNALGTRGAGITAPYTVAGKSAPPANVEGFVVARTGATLKFAWKDVSDLDLDRYVLKKGTVWETAPVVAEVASNKFEYLSPRGGTFMIKAVDTLGNESALSSAVVVPDTGSVNVVVEVDEAAHGWPGVTTNAVVTAGDRPLAWSDMTTWATVPTWGTKVPTGGVLLANTAPWSSYTQPWNTYTQAWSFLGSAPSGSYVSGVIDLGYKTSALIDIVSKVDTLKDPAGAVNPGAQVSAVFELSTSDNGTTWTDFQTFTGGEHSFRYLKARILFSTNDINYRPYLTALLFKIDVPDRVVHFEDIAVPVGGVNLAFNPAFVGVKTVQVTLQSALGSDTFTVTNKTNTGVTIKCFDGSGAPKVGLVDVDVFGYGEKT